MMQVTVMDMDMVTVMVTEIEVWVSVFCINGLKD